MVERGRLSPPELDRLEDCLEHLEDQIPPPDLPPAVAEHLAEYRALTAMVRSALPEVEPPAHIFDRVVNEARAQQGRPDAQPIPLQDSAVAPVPSRRSFWSWLRYGVPGAALAGVAALVLWWARPQVEGIGQSQVVAEPGAVTSARPQAESTSPAASPPPAFSQAELPPPPLEDQPRIARGAGHAVVEGSSAPAAADTRPDRAQRGKASLEPPMEDSSPAMGSESKRAAKPTAGGRATERDRSMMGGGSPPPPTSPRPSAEPSGVAQDAAAGPPAAGEAESATPGSAQDAAMVSQAALRNAHGLRRAGRCGLARLTYEKAIQSSDASLRAHGYAGIGLCEEAEGRDGSAALSRARRSDPRINDFIREERAAMR